VTPTFILLFVGILYILLFGGLSWFRREGLSSQFAIEAIILTLFAAGLSLTNLFPFHPILFFIILYLMTMRVRLLVDFANSFARQGRYGTADRWYRLAERLWPDRTNRLIVWVNQGVSRLQQNLFDEAIQQFRQVLEPGNQAHLGLKYEAAAHYNLGIANQRKGNNSQAIAEFNAAIDCWPLSIYAQRAQTALEKMKYKDKPEKEAGAE